MICCENASSESLENAIFIYVRSIRNILNETSYVLIKNVSYIYSAASCSKQLQNV